LDTGTWHLSRLASVYKPLGLLAELTHRCPLGCPYCSNPLALDARERVCELDTATWLRVFREAAGLGVLQVHLSGGESHEAEAETMLLRARAT
jgi:pyrroloquinoline quinone biosynthesis protein E